MKREWSYRTTTMSIQAVLQKVAWCADVSCSDGPVITTIDEGTNVINPAPSCRSLLSQPWPPHRYRKGAAAPDGNTQFMFKAGDLRFTSDTYQWLVVTEGGTNAQFKGTGLINGDVAPGGGEYGFMIWAKDSDPDTFRIRIWWEDTNSVEHVVYDNGTDQRSPQGRSLSTPEAADACPNPEIDVDPN